MAYIWDTEEGNILMTLDYHTKNIYSIAYSPCNFFVATASEDYSGVIWNLINGTIERVLSLDKVEMLCIIF